MYTKSWIFWRPLHSVTGIYRNCQIRGKLWHGSALGSDAQRSVPCPLETIVWWCGMILDRKQVSIARSTRSELGVMSFVVQGPPRVAETWFQVILTFCDHFWHHREAILPLTVLLGLCTKNNLAPSSDRVERAIDTCFPFRIIQHHHTIDSRRPGADIWTSEPTHCHTITCHGFSISVNTWHRM